MGKSRVLRELQSRLAARSDAPAFYTGRCLPYGSGIVFWALGEVIRAGCEIVDTDTAEQAWGKLLAHTREVMGDHGAHDHGGLSEEGVRATALLGRLIGLEVPAELVPAGEDPARLRERFFAALRFGIEAWACREPLVFAFEDIHWADDGMLEAIEHLAQWVRAPLLLVCLARDELLDRRPGLGTAGTARPRSSCSSRSARPRRRSWWRRCCPRARPCRPRWSSARAETRCSPRRWRAGSPRRAGAHAAELPDTVQGVLAARLDALEPFERRLVQQAAVVGRTFWKGSLAPLARGRGPGSRPHAAVAAGQAHPRARGRGRPRRGA